MHIRHIGKSGLRVSSIGLGCNNFGLTIEAQESKKIIHRALDLGVTLFDTAPVYGTEFGASENILGASLGKHRQDVTIVSKFGMTTTPGQRDSSRSGIIRGLEGSLRRLGTDYLDVFMLHWPDKNTPMQETLRALDDIIRSGKARYIGCCNLPAWQIADAQWIAKSELLHDFIVCQDEYSLVQRKAETNLFPALQHYGMGLMPYSPLANGLLTGKYSDAGKAPTDTRLATNLWNTGDRYLTSNNLALTERLTEYAQQHDHSLLEMAVSWLLSEPLVCSVIAGARSIEQLNANAEAGEWQLSGEQMQEIAALCSQD